MLTRTDTHVIYPIPTVYQVDTNCDGTVDWEEYLTFMLLECRERDIMTTVDLKPFPHTIRLVQSEHRDSIIRIVIVPYISSHLAAKSSYSNLNGRYVACGKDGTVTFWSMGMEHKTSEKVKSFAQTIGRCTIVAPIVSIIRSQNVTVKFWSSCQIIPLYKMIKSICSSCLDVNQLKITIINVNSLMRKCVKIVNLK